MLVVLDTNVLISALLSPDGPPALIHAALRAGVFEAAASRELLAEVADVLARPKVRRYVTEPQASDFLVAVRGLVSVYDTEVMRAGEPSPDPGDDFLLDLVRTAKPDLLMTGDRLLLDLVSVGPTLIVSPADVRVVLEELLGEPS